MSLKTEEVMNYDVVANGIMKDIIDIDKIEEAFSWELSSSELFKIDCAILSTLRNTQDFSQDLLTQLEQGLFETAEIKPQKDAFEQIQQQTIMDITLPLQNMFDEMTDYVAEAFS